MTHFLILAVLALGTGWLVGTHEGMCHVKPGERQHRQLPEWYNFPVPTDAWQRGIFRLIEQFDLGVRGHVWSRYYHAITTGMRAGILILGIMLAHSTSWEPWALVLSLGWLAMEPAMQYARYGTLMDLAYPEHVNFADVIDFHADKRIMLAIRLVLVAVVIITL